MNELKNWCENNFISFNIIYMKKWYKLCPYCGEEIRSAAKKCRYCEEFLEDLDVKCVNTVKSSGIKIDSNVWNLWYKQVSNRMRRWIYIRNRVIYMWVCFVLGIMIFLILDELWVWEDVISMVSASLWFITTWVTIPRSIKRCHDIWWHWRLSILTVIPLISLIMLLILCIKPWTEWENMYGPKPN